MAERDVEVPRAGPSDSITQLVERPIAARVREDVDRAAGAALIGCAAAAAGEIVATVAAAPARPELGTLARLLLLDLSLFALLFLVLVPLLSLAGIAIRLGLWAASGARARSWRGLVPAALRHEGPRPLAAWMWAAVAGGALFVAASTRLTLLLTGSFREQTLAALLLAGLHIVLAGLSLALAWVIAQLLGRLARRLHRPLGRMSPVGHPATAAATLFLLALPAAVITLRLLPQLAPLVPWRHLLSLGLLLLGAHAASHLVARRGGVLPRVRRRRLATAGVLLLAGAVLVPLTLARIGADPATKSLAVSSSPPLRSLIDGVRVATDFDRDGQGVLLGENDCAPFDAGVHRLARDIPDNGVDENCDGRDFQLGRLPTYRSGQRMPVPDGYTGPWNVLLITVDTVRYDHTTMGGYPERTGRDTTPRMAELARRSVSFTFANAPSAGTMASIPAILTSRFFHSGIALDEKVPRGKPPRLLPQNLLLSELFDKAGYRTGAILTHEYFNDWGMEQGFDTYDNELGKKHDPYSVTSARLTDRALAWIGGSAEDRWFLWLHYLDPHGRYVAHPGEVSYGSSEEDLYDGELAFTDKHIGRLLDELARLPGAERTIVVLTSDHGDGFNEHGFINHGFALYRELLHVPLIVYVPNIEPREVPGPVSPIDIFPTLVDLCRLPAPPELAIEGESLVPQLFYRQDARKRIVFAETNAPRPLRAAVSDRYKLVHDIVQNVYELYDLRADPWEKKNLWPGKDPSGFATMKGYLDDWLERVYYARDPGANQVMHKLDGVLLDEPPQPAFRVDGAAYDEGRIEVLGWELARGTGRGPGGGKGPLPPGDKAEIAVYFRAADRPSADYQVQVIVRPTAAEGAARTAAARSPVRTPAGGLLPTTRWRPGEVVRDTARLRIPATWGGAGGGTAEVGLRLTGKDRRAAAPRGPAMAGEPDTLLLGTIQIAPAQKPVPGPAPGKATPPAPGLAPRKPTPPATGPGKPAASR